MTEFNLMMLLALSLFFIGLVGICIRRNLIVMFMCVELMLNSVNLLFITFSKLHNNLHGQIAVIFVMVVAAAEAAIGLALIISVYRNNKSLELDHLKSLRG